MKWIGALLFIATTTLIGFEISRTFHERPKQIRQMKNALQILEAEILYSQLPLPEAFETISKQIPEPISTFFYNMHISVHEAGMDLYNVWDRCVNDLLETSSLSAIEGEIIKQFGRTLGQHDFDHQQKQIHLTINHLDRQLEEARENQFKYGKMAKSLGVLCGLFVVLLLI
ncbi:stage III sporulation protein SpoIIIAB [Lentibacillus halophilus]|uniref:Stage III sporulation protein SpoIIIAB n=1 Tax=Lentibacillus halophilus TaxID=295065 RepID=A0ABN0ZCU8_9BACI